jgi:hypothetical protein
MITRLKYILLILFLMPLLSMARSSPRTISPKKPLLLHIDQQYLTLEADTIKIKKVAKARKLPKPEKLDILPDSLSIKHIKPKRQRRPDGLERPPEIPRRNSN